MQLSINPLRLSAALCAVSMTNAFVCAAPVRFEEPSNVASMLEGAAVLDVRPFGEYVRGHMPGAVHLDDECLRGPASGMPVQYCDAETLAQLFGGAGVGPSETVIIYGGQDDPLAATMAAYALARIGHDNIVLVAGGYESWAANHPTTKDLPTVAPEALVPQAPRLAAATYQDIKPLIGFDSTVFIDARPAAHFRGDAPIWRRNGHIPGAHSLDWTTLTFPDNKHRLLAKADIKKKLDDLGVGRLDDVVVYCGTGREATLLMLALSCELDMPNVRLYEGSWTEYSSIEDAPIEVGQRKPPQTRVFADGRIHIAGQPTKETLRSLADSGITTVISCRSDKEMDGLSFDEADYLETLGLNYVHIPMGGDHGYTTEQVEALADALYDHPGAVLIHCASGGRARYAYMAHLVKHTGMSLEDAWAMQPKLGAQPSAIELLLDTPIVIKAAARPAE
ncbi:MAG: hypothetical protein KDA20_03320 [Phycisphaerales bacterium]|nr:hypothetical protein [Phycisphaerales bacterium]